MNNKTIIGIIIAIVIIIALALVFRSSPADAPVREETPVVTSSPVVVPTTSTSKLPAGSTPSGTIASLTGSTWVWLSTTVRGGGITTPKKADAFTVTFKSDGTITGTTDCNGFFGTYRAATEGLLSITGIGSTKMFCEGSQESGFWTMLEKSVRYTVDAKGTLTLSFAQDDGTMIFKKK